MRAHGAFNNNKEFQTPVHPHLSCTPFMTISGFGLSSDDDVTFVSPFPERAMIELDGASWNAVSDGLDRLSDGLLIWEGSRAIIGPHLGLRG